ncbi:MAG TPA: amidohydrolase family protein [Cyclobacteriaceae bacterium]|nr:amidohydrolase family protein [Cyclobacteriaceae bacterium]
MIKYFYNKRLRPLMVASLLWPAMSWAQQGQALEEKSLIAPVGRAYAITNATIVQGPGRKIEKGTVVMKDGLITAVGIGVSVPPEAIIIKADSMFVYAGFIDGLSRTGVTKPKEEKEKEKVKDPGNPPAERAGITPQNDVRNWLNPNDKSVEELRNLGFTVSQVVPYGNFLPGSAAIVLLGGKSPDDMVLVNNSALYSELSGAQNVYPNTVMAVMAKFRELYRNASLTKSYQSVYAANRNSLPRPENDRILESFYPVIDQRIPVLFKSEKVMETQRVFTLKNDLGFSLLIGDVKEGWPIIPKIKSSGAKVFLSLDLPEEVKKDEKKTDKPGKDVKKDSTKNEEPKKEKIKTPLDLEKEALEKKKKDAIASYTSQPSEFTKAGVTYGFSAMSAKTKDIQANLRRMIKAGLTEDAALAGLTTNPAQLLGLSDRMGTVDNGKMANLVVSYKPYFDEKSKVRYVFVDGALYKMETKEAKKDDKVSAKGNWSYSTETPQGTATGKLVIKEEKGSYSGTITNSFTGKEVEIKNVELDGKKLSFTFQYDNSGATLNVEVSVDIDGNNFEGTMTAGPNGSFPVKATKDPKF